jgi:hypothetical protein
MLLVLFAAPGFQRIALVIEALFCKYELISPMQAVPPGCHNKTAQRPLTQMVRRVGLRKRRQDSRQLGLLDVYQHVGVGKLFQTPRLLSLMLGHQTIDRVATIIVLEDLFVRHWCHAIIVELEPPSVLLGLDERKVVPAVQVARVDEDTVQVIPVVLVLGGRRVVQELAEVDGEGEFVAVIDLQLRYASGSAQGEALQEASAVAYKDSP